MTSYRALTILAAWSFATIAVAAHDAERPNVLFIAADDLRTDLGCYGHPLVRSPNLDRLAASGVLFRRAYCQQALCNPSRASLMCGLRPDTLQIWDLPKHFREARPDVVTLPQLFRQNGYFTQNIGKVYHNWRQEIHGDPDSWSVPAVMHFARHDDDQPQVAMGLLPPNLAQAPRTERRDVDDEAYFDGRIASLAVEALEEAVERDSPFFLAVGFWKPHLPFNPPKKYWDLYDPASIEPAEDDQPPAGVPEVALHDSRELLRAAGNGLTSDDVRELRRGYWAGVSYLDAQVGRLLDALERLKLRRNTIVVFWSDHGFHLGEHGLWAKTSNFELDAHVPLIIATPDGEAAETDALVELVDLYPTLADLCALPPPTDLEGVSLVPVLEDPSARVKPAAYTQHPRPAYYQGMPEVMGVSVRTADDRYTEWRSFRTGDIVAAELYDHRTDPGETRNLISNPPVLGRLRHCQRLLEMKFPRRGYTLTE